MKKLLLFSIGIGLVFLLAGGNVMAYSNLDDITEYATYTGNVVGSPGVAGGDGPVFGIWTEDDTRREWHINWTGEGSTPYYEFIGFVYLYSELDENNFTPVATLAWENNGKYADWVYGNDDDIQVRAWATGGTDEISFGIEGDAMPSYLAFDLRINAWTEKNGYLIESFKGDGMADYIKIGSLGETSGNEDFKILAPVPEPSTILLFGAGLLGLAAYGRKRGLNKRS